MVFRKIDFGNAEKNDLYENFAKAGEETINNIVKSDIPRDQYDNIAFNFYKELNSGINNLPMTEHANSALPLRGEYDVHQQFAVNMFSRLIDLFNNKSDISGTSLYLQNKISEVSYNVTESLPSIIENLM